MLQSQAPIMKISSFLVCLVLVYVRPDDNVGGLADKIEETAQSQNEYLKISGTQNFQSVEAGTTPSLTCALLVDGDEVWWQKGGKNATQVTEESNTKKSLNIKTVGRNDTGNYTCFGKLDDGTEVNHTVYVRVIELGKITGGQGDRVKVGNPAILSCQVQGDPLSDFEWVKIGDTENSKQLKNLSTVVDHNNTRYTMYLKFPSVKHTDNGTYECQVRDKKHNNISSQVPLIVIDVPRVSIDYIKAVGANRVYLNWTVNDRNDPIRNYTIQKMKNGSEEWVYYFEVIGGGNSSYVLKKLDSVTSYTFKIIAYNSVGKSFAALSNNVTTLKEDPNFVPEVLVKGTSITSITIGWSAPPPDLSDHVHFYKIVAHHVGDDPSASIYPAQHTNIYVFEDLKSGTNYSLKVAACSDYTNECGNWSVEQEGHTIDGVASPPQNVAVECKYDNTSSSGSVSITWAEPREPNGKITRYDIVLTGVAEYKNDVGNLDKAILPPTNKSVDGTKTNKSTVFGQVPLNTNYTVHISGVTRLRTSSGQEARGHCTMPRGVPSRENLNLKSWHKVESQDQKLFKVNLPRISERNGPICCYRIFIVKLSYFQTIRDLPDPKDITVYTYPEAFNSQREAAYLAEMYDSDQLKPETFIGDGKTSNSSTNCRQCVGIKPKKPPVELKFMPESPAESQPTVAEDNAVSATAVSSPIQTPDKSRRRKREDRGETDFSGESEPNFYLPEDGVLDLNSNYTGFIEVIVYGNHEGQFFTAYSDYLKPQGFIHDMESDAQSASFGIMMQICIALLVIVLVILMGMCVLHKYLKDARQGGEEIISLRNSFRHLCRNLRGRHQLVSSNPPDMPPISRGDLLQAYIDRHRDSDYGFQHEFEMLPDRFADRTTRASESRENLYKNRYPDIKCYDQTRVRLVQVDGICGSDYINANFVLGYKERKKFICAQGPMENTVCDYWRMIWEQHLELVLMLTNLEEYSKTKCAKYWPDKSESKSFGDITVEHVREIPYSDYVVRELKMTRTGERESRIIIQHHFLVWKDFMAPEHPHAILRFIKRVNEAYSLEKGPILVHCSAGVGRTGTLVALDSLLQQLSEEGQVSIFNTVCDLRHQRNFLVQSLKQYIFVYRALMEMAQFGDTEISANQLKTIVDKLRQRENGKDKSKMEEEYEKISSVLEDRKSFSVGGGDENRMKNRNELVIPYDRNRVILTPVPGREHSTYINASFIEGYDNSESFIITQDPLETTIPDFWRMISEQCASTIVMLSDLSDGPRKCPRYWQDDEVAYDHIRVKYIQSESCPYYTRRELCVLNSKTDESMVVTQYHYHGWPTVEGEVPEVTRGLIELVDQTIANDVESAGPLVVHCSCGSDRSSMFVALSILVQQLRTERRVDIFTTTKKLRSQRHGMIGTFAQYEFLHRAIVNYSDLHNLAEEDASS